MEKTCYGSNVCQEYFTGLFFPCRSYPTEQNEHLNLKIQTEKKCISVYTQLDNESITHDHLRMTQTFMKKKKAGCRIVMVDNNYTIYSWMHWLNLHLCLHCLGIIYYCKTSRCHKLFCPTAITLYNDLLSVWNNMLLLSVTSKFYCCCCSVLCGGEGEEVCMHLWAGVLQTWTTILGLKKRLTTGFRLLAVPF